MNPDEFDDSPEGRAIVAQRLALGRKFALHRILREFERDLDREIAAWSEARRINLIGRRDDESAQAGAP